MNLFITGILLIMFFSCGSHSTRNHHVKSQNYQNREVIKQDYLGKIEKGLTREQINALLTKKIDTNKKVKIAVVRLGHRNELHNENPHYYMANRITNKNLFLTKKAEESINSMISNSPRIIEASPIPEILLPKIQSFKSLRDVAALMQADMLLAIKTRSHSNHDFNWTKENEIKVHATMEALVIDVSSGVIPFTSISSQSLLLEKSEDFSKDEFLKRATTTIENACFKELASAITDYFQ